MNAPDLAVPSRPLEVLRYFTRLGFIAFGGPAAHIALMRRELVVERRWLSDAEFVDLLGVTNLIPGPNSTEMAMHIGGQRAGWRGLWLGGAAFIIPAVLIVLALAWAYVEYGDTPGAQGILYGVQPVVLAIIVQAIWGLRRAAVKGPATVMVLGVVVALALAGVSQILLILGAGVVVFLANVLSGGRAARPWPGGLRRGVARLMARVHGAPAILPPFLAFHPQALAVAGSPAGTSLWELFLVFLKIGGLLYGSGYVLVSFLQAEFVDTRGWLTQQELVDAIAVGQFTPGPLFTSATFVGYLIEGLPGAVVATLGIFLPSFVFVQLTHPLVPRLRRSAWAAPFLDGVNAAALALMGVVTFDLVRDIWGSALQLTLLTGAAVVLVRYAPNSAYLVGVGAAIGVVRELL